MKKLTLYIFLTATFIGSAFAQKSVRDVVKGCKPNMAPYKYDSYAVNDLQFDDKPKVVEVEFSAFSGIDYKILFCSSGFTENVKLNIYDKHKRFKNRTKVFENTEGIDNLFWSFEPPKAGTYYIEMEVPPSKDGAKKTGNVVMLIGYQ